MLVGQIAAVSIAVVGMVVAQILLLSGARRQARVLGVLGTALIVLGLVAGYALQRMAQWFFGRVDNDRFVLVLAAYPRELRRSSHDVTSKSSSSGVGAC